MVSRTGAAKSFAKQLGWQEAITKLFILRPLPNSCDTNHKLHDDITMSDDINKGDNLIDFSEDHFKGINSERVDHFKGDNLLVDLTENGDIGETAKSLENSETKRTSSESLKMPVLPDPHLFNDIKSALSPDVRFSLDLNKSANSEERPSSPQTPQTPLYLKRLIDDDIYSEDEISQSMSRSSSASAEDLSAIGQRRAEQMHHTDSETNTTLKQSESDFSFDTELVTRRESLSSSQINYSDSMRDSLGLRGSFLMESVGDSEELCQNLLMVLLTIMWKGVEGSDKASWQVK